MSDKTIIFYSGKLWHSDKPFPVKPDSKDYTVSALYQADTNYYHNNILPAWLSTAYEVVNPEVMPGFKRLKDVWQVISNESLKNVLKDGDQITLPEGYGIKNNLQWHPVGCEGKWQNTNEYYFDTVQFPCGKRRAATIILPEKTENSAHGQHCGGLNCPAFEYACADVCMRPIIKLIKLAEWFDLKQPGEGNEVQQDLRRIANELPVLRKRCEDLEGLLKEWLSQYGWPGKSLTIDTKKLLNQIKS